MSDYDGLIGERLGSFRIESVLGSGAMGVVYRATSETTGKPAALKVVSGELAPNAKLYERFRRESEILQQFRHPNIVRFLAVGKFRGTSYIAMEFVPGATLEKVLKDRGPLPWREVVGLGVQICDALHYAHEHGVVHRDLKPSNLMVTDNGRIKLTDFGIAKDLDKTALTATGRTLGTAAYMSPEQIRGTPAISHKTDLYALGIVLYQMLVGKPAFEGNSPVVLMHCHLNEPPPRPSSKIAEIPRALDDLILALMAKLPPDRPWDAAAAGLTLRTLQEKIDKGAPIAMVWPAAESSRVNPERPAAPAAAPERGRAKAKGKKSKSMAGLSPSAIASSTRATESGDGPRISREKIETALLVLALVAIGSFILYWVWPYSARYLFAQAESLMASSRRSDWIRARDEYLDELDRRFPGNPYHDQTTIWRDKIALEDATSRAKFLTGPLQSEPATHAEGLFKIAHTTATAASRDGDDSTARDRWRKLADDLKTSDPEDRPWYLYAVNAADKLEKTMKDRRADVERQLLAAELARRNGRAGEADAITATLLEQYGKFKDVADLLPPRTDQPPAAPVPAAGPAPAPAAIPAPPQPTPSPDAATSKPGATNH